MQVLAPLLDRRAPSLSPPRGGENVRAFLGRLACALGWHETTTVDLAEWRYGWRWFFACRRDGCRWRSEKLTWERDP